MTISGHVPSGTAARRPSSTGGPLELLRRHPRSSFFVLAGAMSRVAWLPYILPADGLGWWSYRFTQLPGTGRLLGVLRGGPRSHLGPVGRPAPSPASTSRGEPYAAV